MPPPPKKPFDRNDARKGVRGAWTTVLNAMRNISPIQANETEWMEMTTKAKDRQIVTSNVDLFPVGHQPNRLDFTIQDKGQARVRIWTDGPPGFLETAYYGSYIDTDSALMRRIVGHIDAQKKIQQEVNLAYYATMALDSRMPNLRHMRAHFQGLPMLMYSMAQHMEDSRKRTKVAAMADEIVEYRAPRDLTPIPRELAEALRMASTLLVKRELVGNHAANHGTVKVVVTEGNDNGKMELPWMGNLYDGLVPFTIA